MKYEPPSRVTPDDELFARNCWNFDSHLTHQPHGMCPMSAGNSVEYSRQLYHSLLCRGPIYSSICKRVYFDRNRFDHAFFESTEGNYKDRFSPERAARLPWIPAILADRTAEIRIGYDKKSGRLLPARRVFFWPSQRYLVIIELSSKNRDKARFITAFPLTGRNADVAMRNILASPRP